MQVPYSMLCLPRALALLMLVVCTLVPAGCSRGPKIGKVSGKVTYGGQLVTSGTVTFIPEAGRSAVGEIGPDGTFHLTTFNDHDGALVGNHRVIIHATKVGAGTIEIKTFEDEQKLSQTSKILIPGKVDWLVPEKYSREETSTLTASVHEGTNVIDFDVPPEK